MSISHGNNRCKMT